MGRVKHRWVEYLQRADTLVWVDVTAKEAIANKLSGPSQHRTNLRTEMQKFGRQVHQIPLWEIILEKEKEKRWDGRSERGEERRQPFESLWIWSGWINVLIFVHHGKSTDRFTTTVNHNFATEVNHCCTLEGSARPSQSQHRGLSRTKRYSNGGPIDRSEPRQRIGSQEKCDMIATESAMDKSIF
jgi:hypothetical protein